METTLPHNFVSLSSGSLIHKIKFFFLFLHEKIKGWCILFSFLFCFSTSLFADYTIPSGTTVNASTLTGMTGVLTINGILNVNSNVTLSFSSVILNGPGTNDGQIFWVNNSDLSFSAGTTFNMYNSATGLKPTGENASKRLVIGSVTIAVSSDNSNNSVFSFTEFNGLGGLPEFVITSNSPVCLGATITLTSTPNRTSGFVYYYTWSITNGSGGTLTNTPTTSTGAVSSSITPTNTGTYTVTCLVEDADGNDLATKTSSIVVNALATIALTSAGSTNLQTVSIATPITNITYSVGGSATGATVYTLPPGVTGTYSSGTVTISGTPKSGGNYVYTVLTTGGSCPVTAIGTILVNSYPELKIYSGGTLKMNGAVHMVLKNTGFNNNGTFSSDVSTVKFSGDKDTTIAYVKGNSTSTFYNLSSDKTAYGLVLKSPTKVRNVLSITASKLFTDSNLTLLSNANLTARVDVVPSGVSIVGKAMVERYMPPRRAWRLMTAPVSGANTIFSTWQNNGVYEAGKGTWVTGPGPTGVGGNGLDVSPQNNYSMRKFNFTTQAFTNVSNTYDKISAGSAGVADNTGYFIFVRGDRVWENFNFNTGECNTTTLTSIGNLQTGSQTFSASTTMGKYTLIGNPYASPVDFSKIIRTNVVNRFYILDPTRGTVGTWVMLDDTTNTGSYISSMTTNMTTAVQSGQAFFVITNGNVGSASVTFNESCKTDTNVNNILGRPVSAPRKIAALRSNLYLADADTSYIVDGDITQFDETFEAAVTLHDATKIANTNENFGLYRDGINLCAERRPMLTESDTLFFRIWRTTQRKYRLEFEPYELSALGLQGFLEDSYLKTSTPVSLSATTKVDFEINADPASADMFRFRIVFKQATDGPLPVSITNVNAYIKNNAIAVEWKVEHELDILRYEIERSSDGIVFEPVGTKDAVGQSNTNNLYSWLDIEPLKGNNFYRIKIIDKTGSIKYTAVVKVFTGNEYSGINIYPNPVKNGIINLKLNNQPKGNYGLRLFNSIGQVIYTNKLIHNSSNASYALRLANAVLAAGVYQLEITRPDKSSYKQPVIVELFKP